MTQRRRFKQTEPLQERLRIFAEEARAQALGMRPGAERDELMLKARQAETASHLDEWATSLGLQPPK